eukprot:509381-Prorocentrum_minimum.AAC.2
MFTPLVRSLRLRPSYTAARCVHASGSTLASETTSRYSPAPTYTPAVTFICSVIPSQYPCPLEADSLEMMRPPP